jgi:cation:H+ antiporter
MREALVGALSGHGVWLPLVVFAIVGGVVFALAARLAEYADAVSEVTGWGRVWVGAVLLGAATSLPELITDVEAAALGAPDIGVGDLFGSGLANMTLLALIDLLFRRRRVLDTASPDQVMVGALSVVMTATAAAAVASGGWGRIGHVGVETIVLIALYAFGIRRVGGEARSGAPPPQLELGASGATVLRRASTGFAIAVVGLTVAAPVLVLSSEAIAVEGGLSEAFLGTVLVGLTTSLPELAATVAAARRGAVDLAVGNIFGSNAFNMCVLFAMDLVYRDGPLLAHVSGELQVSALFAILAMSLGIFGTLARRARRISGLRVESVLIVLVYVGAVWMLGTASAER